MREDKEELHDGVHRVQGRRYRTRHEELPTTGTGAREGEEVKAVPNKVFQPTVLALRTRPAAEHRR